MKLVQLTYGLIILAVLVAPLGASAGGGRKSFEVCVNPAADFALVDHDASETPTAGDVFTAVGGIWPKGTIPEGGAFFDCSEITEERIGTFYVNGHFVRSLIDLSGFPAAPADDLALVVWHFTLDEKGTVDTIGPVKAVAIGESYPQTIVGGTGRFKSAKGVAKTTVLGGDGFQFRLTVSDGNNDHDDDGDDD